LKREIFFEESEGIYYLLAQAETPHGTMGYFLVCLESGGRYTEPTEDIDDVFAGDRDEFLQLSEGDQIKITVGP